MNTDSLEMTEKYPGESLQKLYPDMSLSPYLLKLTWQFYFLTHPGTSKEIKNRDEGFIEWMDNLMSTFGSATTSELFLNTEEEPEAIIHFRKGLSSLVGTGIVSNRDEIIRALIGQGFVIEQVTPEGIQITVEQKTLWLNGWVFSEAFSLKPSSANDQHEVLTQGVVKGKLFNIRFFASTVTVIACVLVAGISVLSTALLFHWYGYILLDMVDSGKFFPAVLAGIFLLCIECVFASIVFATVEGVCGLWRKWRANRLQQAFQSGSVIRNENVRVNDGQNPDQKTA